MNYGIEDYKKMVEKLEEEAACDFGSRKTQAEYNRSAGSFAVKHLAENELDDAEFEAMIRGFDVSLFIKNGALTEYGAAYKVAA